MAAYSSKATRMQGREEAGQLEGQAQLAGVGAAGGAVDFADWPLMVTMA
jgi:hypothetical protein